jgi:choline kinase/mannose-6-phosphate isomerase-like protein (cupin superfamily)/thiamine kinase-like enzyme
MKTVYKPWGKEEWLELNDKYCYKRLYINAGHKTSFQYHEYKQETNYIISGTAEVWLENDKGEIVKTVMKDGDYFSVLPPQKHRIIAMTDLILQEVSTPEVDDVIRIEDDANRTSGRLEHEHMKPVLCIVAAGKGTRMGSYAKHINKGLLPINNKAIISDIIDKTPKDFEIVIALGYKSQQVIEYCEAAHPDRTFKFVQIENYDGKGTGPGTTLLQCKKYLQSPFYFVTGDCLIKDELPLLDCNWLGLYPTSIPEIYSSVKMSDQSTITNFKNKDKNGYDHAFIGLCGILDYELFWNELESNIGESGEMVSAFYNIEKYNAKGKILNWYDIGTIENYIKAQQTFQGPKFGIPKTNGQFLYKVGDRCVKIFQSPVTEKIHRAKNLNGYVPELVYEGQNTIAYKWIEGDTLYDAEKEKVGFINWIGNEIELNRVDENIKDDCFKFYHNKTMNRLTQFLDKKQSSFKNGHIINGKKCDSIFKYLEKINWDELCTSTISTKIFHGDLQFDNIIKTDDGYKFIDWRDNFGDSIDYADSYYDLAKLYGGICMNYSFMKDEINYEFIKSNGRVQYEFKVDNNVDYLKRSFYKLCKTYKFDLIKIQKLTALIYLNMAPLHDNGFDDLLFFHATKILDEIYNA